MIKISVLLIAFLILLSGCSAKQVKTYDGPEKPLQEIALVKCAPSIIVNRVDGNKELNAYAGSGLWYRDCEISVLPGQHIFDVCFRSTYSTGYITVTNRCKKDFPVKLDAQAGKTYRITYERKWSKWRAWAENITKGE